MKKINIMIVDEGVAFGGAFIVAARLTSNLDQSRFNATIVTATNLDDVRHHVAPHVELIYLRKKITYVDRIKARALISKVPGNYLRRFLTYAYAAYEKLSNIPYTLKQCLIIYRKDIDVVHANNAPETIDAARLMNKKIVWHVHGDGLVSSSRFIKKLNKVDKVIAISRFNAGNIIKSGADANKVIVIHNPTGDPIEMQTSTQKIALRHKLSIPDDSVVVGIFGRIVEWKGQLEFLQAINAVHKRGVNLVALLVGSDGETFGDYTAQLKQFIDREGIAERVKFTGYIKNTNDYYQICDLVVHASIAPEPFGLVIIEAMQNGVPVIASCHGAGPEIVNHQETGLIVDPQNTESLANAIEELIKSEDRRRLFAVQAGEYVNEYLRPESYARKMASIYQSI
jgi:glycosyltransferase involved in cell wall biosynthesis